MGYACEIHTAAIEDMPRRESITTRCLLAVGKCRLSSSNYPLYAANVMCRTALETHELLLFSTLLALLTRR